MSARKNVDARHKAGHDSGKLQRSSHAVIARSETTKQSSFLNRGQGALLRWHGAKVDCFATLAMTGLHVHLRTHPHPALRATLPTKGGGIRTHLRDLAARCVRVLQDPFAPNRERAQGMPGARCTRSLACEIGKHTS